MVKNQKNFHLIHVYSEKEIISRYIQIPTERKIRKLLFCLKNRKTRSWTFKNVSYVLGIKMLSFDFSLDGRKINRLSSMKNDALSCPLREQFLVDYLSRAPFLTSCCLCFRSMCSCISCHSFHPTICASWEVQIVTGMKPWETQSSGDIFSCGTSLLGLLLIGSHFRI